MPAGEPPQAKFCLECATPPALPARTAARSLPPGRKFCFECATPSSLASSPPRFAGPESYTPKHLAEKILTSKAALEGERKQVTVLFADLKGSMELLADRDPEEARKLLDPVLEQMMEAVHRYEGTVNQVMGDGIMALFGAPLAHEDHAVRACFAGAADAGGSPAAPIILLVNYRPEYSHGWGSKTFYSQLRLDPLPPERADDLLRALLGVDPVIEPLKHMLAARTHGNPLFLEESVRALVETGVLAGEHGAYRPARSVEAVEVPATVQAILAARIDRLPAEEKRLLQAASVVGKDVPLELLRAVADLGEQDLLRLLARLTVAEFLYETGLFPDSEYTFKHALTHEVA